MNERKPTFGSLFAGIGGIDLGLERAGWECKWQVEWDGYCRKVLGKHWPDVLKYGDIKGVHGPLAHTGAGRVQTFESLWSGGSDASRCGSCLDPVDLICGGFPCQPVSTAGKRKAQADERWLWPEFARIVRDLQPKYVLVENVPGLLSANNGSAFGEVLGDLATLGYDAEWESIPAAAVGAPHLRFRVFVVAYDGYRLGQEPGDDKDQWRAGAPSTSSESMAYSNDGGRASRLRPSGITGSQEENTGSEPSSTGKSMADARRIRTDRLQPFGLPGSIAPAVVGRGSEDVPDPDTERFQILSGGAANAELGRLRASCSAGWWTTEPDVGRVAHGVPSRVDRLRALGNAVVPQVAEYVGGRILEHGRLIGWL